MISIYREFAADLDRLRKHLARIESKRRSGDERKFDYVAIISTLYANFENFAERLAYEFAKQLLSDSDGLEQSEIAQFKKRYVKNASALLGQTLGTGRYEQVTEFDIAQSLASCLDETAVFDIHAEVATFHNSNLRWESLASLFSWATQDLRANVGKSDAVAVWLGSTQAESVVPVEAIDEELKFLVDRRNEIAHRGFPDDILTPSRMLQLVEYVDTIALGIISCLGGRLLESSRRTGKSIVLGTPSEILKNHRVAIVGSLNAEVAVGAVVWTSESGKTRWGSVRSIQLNGVSVDVAEAGAEAGLLLDFPMQKNAALHMWLTPTSELAPPPEAMFNR